MSGAILVFNAGSSSLKFALFAQVEGGAGELTPLYRGQLEDLSAQPCFIVDAADGARITEEDLVRPGTEPLACADALEVLLKWIATHDGGREIAAVGHRVVHGGERFSAPEVIDAEVLHGIEALTSLAPLHQPASLAPIRAMAALRPGLLQVACFDTAFHATLPERERTFAIGADLRAFGLRRYGFHGLSYESIAASLPVLLGAAAHRRVIVAHLGNGASMCAMHDRRSVATTMGFTALDGLMMGTRCGSLDPGAVLHLIRHAGIDAAELERRLYREAGLLGVSGLSNDMRTLLASELPSAALAIDIYCYRIVREFASLAGALGGVDAIVFTGGVGEHAVPVRARVLEGLQWMGVTADLAANGRGEPRISAASSQVSAWVIPTNEEAVVARHAFEAVRQHPPRA